MIDVADSYGTSFLCRTQRPDSAGNRAGYSVDESVAAIAAALTVLSIGAALLLPPPSRSRTTLQGATSVNRPWIEHRETAKLPKKSPIQRPYSPMYTSVARDKQLDLAQLCVVSGRGHNPELCIDRFSVFFLWASVIGRPPQCATCLSCSIRSTLISAFNVARRLR